MVKPFNNGDRVSGRSKALQGKTGVVIGAEGSGHKRNIAVKWDDGSQGAYSLKAIDRDWCVSNKRMRLRHYDCEMEGRTHYAESSESDDDEAMSSDADPTETEVAETLDHERYAKGNEYYIFCDTQKGTSIMIRKRERVLSIL